MERSLQHFKKFTAWTFPASPGGTSKFSAVLVMKSERFDFGGSACFTSRLLRDLVCPTPPPYHQGPGFLLCGGSQKNQIKISMLGYR